MLILVMGSYGFIGSKITADLMIRGHELIGFGKNQELHHHFFPSIPFIQADFSQEITVDEWLQKLSDIPVIDCIINTIGILQAKDSAMTNIHYLNPRNLILAAMQKGLRKVIQISALGVDKIEIPFANSKKQLDDYLMTLPITVFVVRPSLVYGEGSYGGTSLFRGLAGLPYFIPLPRKGEAELFQPIHLNDLSKAVIGLVEQEEGKKVLTAVGPERVSIANIVLQLRNWLGFGSAKLIFIPNGFLSKAVWLTDKIGKTRNSTLLEMLAEPNVASEKEKQAFESAVKFNPQSFSAALYKNPSRVQDRWHARLYFLKPLLRFSLGFLWLFTGLTALFFYPKEQSLLKLHEVGVAMPLLFLYSASILDMLLGIATFCNYKIKLVGIIQIVLITVYTLIISVAMPQLWLDPFGSISKNIPILVATAMMIAMESKR